MKFGERMKIPMLALSVAILAIPQSASAQTGKDVSRMACDFSVLTSVQRAAQTDAKAHRIPALLGQVSGELRPMPLDGVYVSDDAIERKIMVQSVFARRTPNQSLEVLTRVVNCTDYPLQIMGRTSFLDANTFPTEDPSAWKTIFVGPRSFATYQEVSIGGSNVASYLIEMISNR